MFKTLKQQNTNAHTPTSTINWLCESLINQIIEALGFERGTIIRNFIEPELHAKTLCNILINI